jgi:hypothetical protein
MVIFAISSLGLTEGRVFVRDFYDSMNVYPEGEKTIILGR